jgi:hypothetical protein
VHHLLPLTHVAPRGVTPWQGAKTEAETLAALASSLSAGSGPVCAEFTAQRPESAPRSKGGSSEQVDGSWRCAVAVLPLADAAGKTLCQLWVLCDADQQRKRQQATETDGWATKWLEQVGVMAAGQGDCLMCAVKWCGQIGACIRMHSSRLC